MDPKFSTFKACAFCHFMASLTSRLIQMAQPSSVPPPPPPTSGFLRYAQIIGQSGEVGEEEDLSLVLLDICINKASSVRKARQKASTLNLRPWAGRTGLETTQTLKWQDIKSQKKIRGEEHASGPSESGVLVLTTPNRGESRAEGPAPLGGEETACWHLHLPKSHLCQWMVMGSPRIAKHAVPGPHLQAC